MQQVLKRFEAYVIFIVFFKELITIISFVFIIKWPS